MSFDELQEIFPKDWLKKELGEVCLKVSKIDPLDLGREVFKYVDIGSIDNATKAVASPQILSVKNAPGRARQLIQEGDTVFSTVRPYMRNIAYINESLDGEIASTGFCVIRPNSEFVSKGFIKFFSSSDNLLEQILPLQRGVSYPAVRDKDLFSASVLVPPLIEQQRIVEILEEQLSRLDAALVSVRAVREKAARFRRSLLHAAFNGALTGHDTSFSDLPKDWLRESVGDFASIKTGKIDVNAAVENGLYPFFTCAREIYRIDEAPYVGRVVLIAGNGDLNVKYYEGRFNAYQRTYFLTVHDEAKLLPKYLYLFMEMYVEHLRKISIGTTIKYIKLGDLRDAIISVPALDEQEKIVEILEAQLSRLAFALDIADAIERKASAMRRSLLYSAFTGELTKEWREGAHV
jgi:type I restriction enzyme S subunit